MGEIINHTIAGICCDKHDCDERIYGPEMSFHKGQNYYHALGYEKGWTCFVGRSRRWYCPSHAPVSKHMTELKPRRAA